MPYLRSTAEKSIFHYEISQEEYKIAQGQAWKNT